MFECSLIEGSYAIYLIPTITIVAVIATVWIGVNIIREIVSDNSKDSAVRQIIIKRRNGLTEVYTNAEGWYGE